MHVKPAFIVLSTTVLAACGGDDGDSFTLRHGCLPISGGATQVSASVSAGCTGCDVIDRTAAIDGRDDTFATLFMPAGAAGTLTVRATAQPGVVFPAGSLAGMLHSITFGTSVGDSVRVRTYAGGQLQEDFNFNNGSVTSSHDPAQPGRASFSTSEQYDAVELQFTRAGGTGVVEARVHAFCSNDKLF